jgi:dihydroorotase
VTYDLLVKHGFLVDPSQGIEDIRDIAISNGKVMLFSSRINGSAKEVLDVTGMIVTPGLIDLHAHVYRDDSDSGSNVDVHCLLK